MRHVNLTCKHHPDKRWNCKSVAVNPNGTYNGLRNIFYSGPGLECNCPASDLRIAPEDEWATLTEDQVRQAIAND